MEDSNVPSNGSNNQLPDVITDRLRIEGTLGRGGMGTVYKATHLSLDREVALKIINPEFAANTDITQRFAREARLMAKLRHPRAAMIYDTGSLPDGRSFIIMEYVEGKTLARVLKEESCLPYQKAVEIAISICDVLQEAHSLGIVHRDLKPANIMLNERGVFVLDFGIAKMLEGENGDNSGLSVTGTGILVGTPYYMSPEQCLGQPVEARSDLYSLGALLYEMLAGRPPFNDKTLSAIIVKHATAEPPALAEFCQNVPPQVAAVVNQLLAKNPEHRPANAAAARTLLQSSIHAPGSADIHAQAAPPTFISTRPEIQPEARVTQNMNAVTGVNATQPLNAVTASQPAPLINQTAGASGKNRALTFGITAALAFVAVVASGAAVWFALNPGNAKVATDAATKPPVANTGKANTASHSQHTASMDTDFVANMGTSTVSSGDKSGASSAPLLSTEEANAVITKITQDTHHVADGMQIVKTPKDSALVCLHNRIEEGKTHLFTVERPNPNGAWDISARVSLDVPEFKSANWKFEPQDVDKDGFEEVVFSGSNADNTARRALIYVPRTRQSYSILTENGAGKSARSTLSPNANTPNAAAYRAALEQSVKASSE